MITGDGILLIMAGDGIPGTHQVGAGDGIRIMAVIGILDGDGTLLITDGTHGTVLTTMDTTTLTMVITDTTITTLAEPEAVTPTKETEADRILTKEYIPEEEAIPLTIHVREAVISPIRERQISTTREIATVQ